METTIMDVLDSAKGSADEITHILYLYGGGNMGKGIERFFEETLEMGQRYKSRQIAYGVLKFTMPIVIGCMGFQIVKYIKLKRRSAKNLNSTEDEV